MKKLHSNDGSGVFIVNYKQIPRRSGVFHTLF